MPTASIIPWKKMRRIGGRLSPSRRRTLPSLPFGASADYTIVTRGAMATDAAANGVFGIILLIVAMFAGHHWYHRGKPAGSAAIA
jgi:hypothetical protein